MAKATPAKRPPAKAAAASPAGRAAAGSAGTKGAGKAKAAPAKASAAKAQVEPGEASAKAGSSKGPAGKAGATKATGAGSAKTAPAKKAPATKAPAKKAGAAAVPAATPKRSPFSASWLAKQEEELRRERATYLRQADSLQAEAEALVADFQSSDSQFDEDGGEGDTLSSERERDLALSAQARAAVEEIDHALAKFAKGTYGICEASGDPIPKERLEAIPWARVQVQYKTGGIGRL